MITLYSWNTPNGQKPAILLEALGLDYTLVPIDVSNGEQHGPDFEKLNPNEKIPTLQLGETTIFESGAILVTLAEQNDRFLPSTGQARADALAWTFWQVGGLGPMIGQWGHFLMADETLPYAIERFLSETLRLFAVLEKRLSGNPFLAGDAYSIADMMSFPWAKGGLEYLENAAADRLPDLTNVRDWIDRINARPAVKTALARIANTQHQHPQ